MALSIPLLPTPNALTRKGASFVRRILRLQEKTAGLPPGSIVYVGEKPPEHVTISLMDYDKDKFTEKEVRNVEECFPFKDTATVTWINIYGLHETALIQRLGEHFGLHPLVLEDVANTAQRPKREDFDDYIYFVVKMLKFDEQQREIRMEQVSVILGKNYILSFQEGASDVFELVRQRIREDKGNLRKRGPDYLAYRLIDAIVDNYFSILEKIGDSIVEMEDELLSAPSFATLHKINNLKRELIFIRKSVWPMREVVGGFEREPSPLIKKATLVYFRDVYDHTIQVIDSVETFRDMLSGMSDLYLSSVSNRMNEVMKVLTVMASIFIPLTFVAGIYGMNFEYMPELQWRYGYFWLLGVMLALALAMLFVFRRKGWI